VRGVCNRQDHLCGPMGVNSIGGARYVMVLVDDHSRYTWVYFLPLNDLWPPYLSLRTSLTSTERTQHCHYRQRLRSPRPEAMCSKQWEMYLVRLKQWEQRAQWEPKRQTGRRQEKMPSEVSRTSPSSEAGELDPRYARSPAPKPEPEPEEEQVPEGAGRFVTRSGRRVSHERYPITRSMSETAPRASSLWVSMWMTSP